MANYYCKALTEIAEKDLEKVKVPTGATVYPGQVIMAETLDTTDSANREVYLGAAPTDVTADYPCIVLNKPFEQLSDKRRPAGQPDISQLYYSAGEICNVVRLSRDYKFEVAQDSIETTVPLAVGGVVVPVNSAYQMKSLASAVGTEKVILGVEKEGSLCTGGNFGATFAETVILRVKEGR